MTELSVKIVSMRQARNLSQEDAARLIGISRATLSKAETGFKPSFETFRKIMDCYGVEENQTSIEPAFPERISIAAMNIPDDLGYEFTADAITDCIGKFAAYDCWQ